ncbi:ATP-binding protein [Streptomyces sp. NPDC002476]|uniref:ATP-binding protein n=1 Tax=Streptomyces sp. NPDC002476 TaxID=3364648 RepID=UPI00367ECE9D
MKQEITLPQHGGAVSAFTVLLSPTRRGARLARLLATTQLDEWGVTSRVEAAAQIVAELAANAVAHGRVRGRDIRLGLGVYGSGSVLRIEVSDARGDRLPPEPGHTLLPGADRESGRGLLIVEALADRWGISPGPLPCKTVWAELDLDLDPDPAP